MDEENLVLTVGEILQARLSLSEYQRPYRWHAEKHVKQLLQDLNREKEKPESKYRIGTVILHKSENAINIVDGQQRLVTLSLIIYAIDSEDKCTQLLENDFTHTDSKNNLKYNYNYIQRYLGNKTDEEKKNLKDFILNKCEVLKIQLSELSEAFQLFDSQNARGKELDPADLLKAYHLREMEGVFENEKHRIVNRWEEIIEKKKLNDVLGNYLFRIRNWSRNESKYFFTKHNVNEFKGVSPSKMLHAGWQYPYLYKLAAHSSSIFFEFNQPIVNGKWFFAYVSHYSDLVDRINDICKEDEPRSMNYEGSGRVGDRRLIKLYKNLLLVYLDKFGEDKNFKTYRSLLYRWVFITRLENTQIRYETVLKKMQNKNHPIHWISKWTHPELDIMEMKLIDADDIKNNSNQDRKDYRDKDSIYAKLKVIEGNKQDML